jgi:NAD(P)H-quinone oxidoreductase subunit 5
METPTPVSALMHAGIVNAGGYLIIRTSPLIALTPWALTAVAIIGGFTACFAAVVMLTQTSIKKSLAYSTIAQMGFMLLQCGLGAFSAAMLHILAHSLYKAYAFLSSGSALSEPTITSTKSAVDHSSVAFRLVLVGSSLMGLLAFALALLGIDLIAKPGGFVLGGILCFALTHWIGQVMKAADRQLLVPALAMASTLCLVYAVSYFAVDKTISASLPISAAPSLAGFVVAVVLVGFLGMGVLHLALANERGRRVLTRWYIHASNGFYMESTLRRLLGPLAERY